MPQVDIAGVGTIEFPDDATDDEILAFANDASKPFPKLKGPESFRTQSTTAGGPAIEFGDVTRVLADIPAGIADVGRTFMRPFSEYLPQAAPGTQERRNIEAMMRAQIVSPSVDEGPINKASPISSG